MKKYTNAELKSQIGELINQNDNLERRKSELMSSNNKFVEDIKKLEEKYQNACRQSGLHLQEKFWIEQFFHHILEFSHDPVALTLAKIALYKTEYNKQCAALA